MKISRIFAVLIAVLMFLSTVFSAVSAETEDNAVTKEGSLGYDAAVPFLGSGALVENTEAAFLYEINTNSLMYSWNPDQQIYPSSLVKIMTTLLAVEKGDPEAVVTVEQAVLDTVPFDAVSADLVAGEQMTLSDLLYCLMVGSANDAAAVIAHYISGSQEAFIQAMNARAVELGCTNTNFTNPHGLHDDAQYTTVRDMARILGAAVENEMFMKYFSEVDYLVPATNKTNEARNLASGNFLRNNGGMEIYYDARVTGGRTGTANDGTRCLASSAEQNGMKLICIVTGCESTFTDSGKTMVYGSFLETISLYDAGFNGYKSVRVLYDGQSLKQLPVINGASDVVLGTRDNVLTILPDGVTLEDLSYRFTPYYDDLEYPISAGEPLTRMEIWYNFTCVAKTDLYALNDVSPANSLTTDLGEENSGSVWPWIVGFVIGIPLFVLLILVVLRGAGYVRRFIIRKRSDKYRRNRRRSR